MRFYFDIDDGSRTMLDDEGYDICSMRVLRETVVRLLGAMAQELPSGLDHHAFSVTVRDIRGRNVIEAELSLDVRWCDAVTRSPVTRRPGEIGSWGAEPLAGVSFKDRRAS